MPVVVGVARVTTTGGKRGNEKGGAQGGHGAMESSKHRLGFLVGTSGRARLTADPERTLCALNVRLSLTSLGPLASLTYSEEASCRLACPPYSPWSSVCWH